MRQNAFEPSGEGYRPGEMFRQDVTFLKQDIRYELPSGDYHLILCRNLAFTYFEDELQSQVVAKILNRLALEGVFAVGSRESLPKGEWPLGVLNGKLGTYLKKDRR